ncbi:hypothetical protein B0H19DRAFT_965088, partial [Mycena capillaripes]
GSPRGVFVHTRRFYHIASVCTVVVTPARVQTSRAVLLDSLIRELFAALYIAPQHIVQSHRFEIFEDIRPALYNTLPPTSSPACTAPSPSMPSRRSSPPIPRSPLSRYLRLHPRAQRRPPHRPRCPHHLHQRHRLTRPPPPPPT